MKKAELVAALSNYADHAVGGWQRQYIMARFLAYYFNELEIPADHLSNYWDIEDHIPQLLLGALEVFRTSEDPVVRELRASYEEEVGQPFIDLTNISGNSLWQLLAVQNLGDLFRVVIGSDDIALEIGSVFNAERLLLQQVFYKFLDRVFRRGLFQVAETVPYGAMRGDFGETSLRTFKNAGRFMFTFSRPGEVMQQGVSFICGDDDPLGLGGGLESLDTDLSTAISMINDVITGWPEDRSALADILRADGNVSIS